MLFNFAVSAAYVGFVWSDFVRSGIVTLDRGSMRNSGRVGRSWSSSSTTYSSPISARAYYLDFNASGVNPLTNDNRWLGLPVRCLVY